MSYKLYLGGFRKLLTWQRAHDLTLAIYKTTKSFSKEEQFAMTSQLRRAAYSIESQIAEGSRMQTQSHKKSFYDRSYGSCVEVDNFLELAHDLGYINDEAYSLLLEKVNKTAYLLKNLISSCKNQAG